MEAGTSVDFDARPVGYRVPVLRLWPAIVLGLVATVSGAVQLTRSSYSSPDPNYTTHESTTHESPSAIRAQSSPRVDGARSVPLAPFLAAGTREANGPDQAMQGPISGGCLVDADCDDSLGCTNDVCNPLTGSCENAANFRETICRTGYLETEPGFACVSDCSGDGTEPCVPGVDENILSRLGIECPKRYTFHNVLPVSGEVRLTTWALGSYSSPDTFYNIHLVGTNFTQAEIYKVGQDDCTSAAPHVLFTISVADWNTAIDDAVSGVGDIIFEITASPAVFCGDCAFSGGVHLEFELEACDDGVACTDDVCDPIFDCLNTPNNARCDDEQFCNGVEVCDAALGCVIAPDSVPDCDDGVGCTNDSCNEVTDSCETAASFRETVCRPGYLETQPGFACESSCSALGTEPCAVDGDPTILGRLGIDCPKRYTFFDVLDVSRNVQLTTWAKGNYSGNDQFYNIHLVGTDFTEPGIYGVAGQVDCSDAPPPVNFTIPAAQWNAAIMDLGSGMGDIVFEITASPSVSCSDCGFNGGVHLEFELQTCDDGLFCNGVETCDAVADCQTSNIPCTDPLFPFCDEAGDACVACVNDADCDDGDFCNGPEACVANVCQSGITPCTDPLLPACDEATDACVACLANVDCDDGLFCNGSETCAAGACQPGTTPCTDPMLPVCDEPTDGCVACLIDSDCDDTLFCNGVETCDAVSGCLAGNDPCTDPLLPACDEGADACVECLSDTDCDDGLFCNGEETCAANVCQLGSPPIVNDEFECTVDTCDEDNDIVVHAPDDAFCDDGLFCNGVETCDAVSGCLTGSIPCTNPPSMCDEAINACVTCVNDTDCDDGVFCNGDELCTAGVCQTGTPPCSDPQAAFCDEAGAACVQCLADSDCNDNVFCDGLETCIANICEAGTPPIVDDGIDCTVDSCDEVNDVIVHAPNDAFCSDGIFCNGVETCDAQMDCLAGAAPCNDPLTPFCDETTAACVECLAIGDVNGDEAIDLIDFEGFGACRTGPVEPADPPAYAPSCRCFDVDMDGDIDLIDFQSFQRDFVGAKP